MKNELIFSMSKQIAEISKKPLRSKEEAILVLLYTIRMFDIAQYLDNDALGKIIIHVNKMNRIFYVLDEKTFSMQFPFSVEETHDQKGLIISHKPTGITINSMVLSVLIEIIEKMNKCEMDFESLFDIIMDSDFNNDNFSPKQRWLIVLHLLKYDLGYIRYDIDYEHENGDFHPINHLDICLDSAATYKIGLQKKIDQDDFIDIMDLSSKCWYISPSL